MELGVGGKHWGFIPQLLSDQFCLLDRGEREKKEQGAERGGKKGTGRFPVTQDGKLQNDSLLELN